jgi:hypothetical protein
MQLASKPVDNVIPAGLRLFAGDGKAGSWAEIVI